MCNVTFEDVENDLLKLQELVNAGKLGEADVSQALSVIRDKLDCVRYDYEYDQYLPVSFVQDLEH